MDISKKDWKLFREKLSDWQENYMEGLVKEYRNFCFPVLLRTDLNGIARRVDNNQSDCFLLLQRLKNNQFTGFIDSFRERMLL